MATAQGFSKVSVDCRRNGVPLADGPRGRSPGGDTVSDRLGPLQSRTNSLIPAFIITNAEISPSG